MFNNEHFRFFIEVTPKLKEALKKKSDFLEHYQKEVGGLIRNWYFSKDELELKLCFLLKSIFKIRIDQLSEDC